MTSDQVKCIEFLLWKRPDSIPESQWLTFDEWKKIKPNMDLGVASDVITALKKGNYTIAIKQLKHLAV